MLGHMKGSEMNMEGMEVYTKPIIRFINMYVDFSVSNRRFDRRKARRSPKTGPKRHSEKLGNNFINESVSSLCDIRFQV